jgi:hypothetical protein
MPDLTEIKRRLQQFLEASRNEIGEDVLGDLRALLAAVPEWRDIESDPPEFGRVVILYGEWEAIRDDSRYWSVETGMRCLDGRYHDAGEGFDAWPTHWMPLPQPPGGEDANL